MSLFKKMCKNFLGFCLFASFFLKGCDIYTPPLPDFSKKSMALLSSQKSKVIAKQVKDKKLALALIAKHDYNGATEGMETMFKNDFLDIPNYQLYTERIESMPQIFLYWNDYAKIKKIDTLILAFHGREKSLDIDYLEQIDFSNLERLFENYDILLAEDARVILYSCASGKGKDNIANRLEKILKRKIIAPKFPLMPGTDLSGKVNEFISEDGNVGFNEKDFCLYSSIQFKGEEYENYIALKDYNGIIDKSFNEEFFKK